MTFNKAPQISKHASLYIYVEKDLNFVRAVIDKFTQNKKKSFIYSIPLGLLDFIWYWNDFLKFKY